MGAARRNRRLELAGLSRPKLLQQGSSQCASAGETPEVAASQHAAATKLQAAQRGKIARRRFARRRADHTLNAGVPDDAEEAHRADGAASQAAARSPPPSPPSPPPACPASSARPPPTTSEKFCAELLKENAQLRMDLRVSVPQHPLLATSPPGSTPSPPGSSAAALAQSPEAEPPPLMAAAPLALPSTPARGAAPIRESAAPLASRPSALKLSQSEKRLGLTGRSPSMESDGWDGVGTESTPEDASRCAPRPPPPARRPLQPCLPSRDASPLTIGLLLHLQATWYACCKRRRSGHAAPGADRRFQPSIHPASLWAAQTRLDHAERDAPFHRLLLFWSQTAT